MKINYRQLLGGLLTTFFALSFAANAASTRKLEFNNDVRPILSQNCFACHGADSAARKGDLRLDRFDDATAPRKDSVPAIVPGKPDASGLVRRILATDEDDLMPPPKTHKVLSPEQKQVLKNWIANGAQYQAHWSLIAPVRSPLPKIRNQKWARNPIDNFILARVEREGLKPANEADRRTLARRASLDLTGLPPKPEEVEAFVNDKSRDAYEKFVDHLLESPRYGEHRARYWLDVARYGDSNGIHIDNYREIYPYRDWVIKSFNRNQRFNQFTIEQLAGDLLPNFTVEQDIATGFNRCNITTSEGGAIDEEYLVLYARDRTEATSQVWLGLTAGCAVCHDHKFDKLSQKEFYSLSAFFNNNTQKAMDGNVKDTPPIIILPLPADQATWDALPLRLKEAEKKVEKRREVAQAEFEVWLTNASPGVFLYRLPQDKLLFHAPLDEMQKTVLATKVRGESRPITLMTNAASQDGVIAASAYLTTNGVTPEIAEVGDFEKDQKFSCSAWVYLTKGKEGAVIARMDSTNDLRGWDLWLEDAKPGTHMISKWPDDAIKVVSKKALEMKRWTHIGVTYDGSSKGSGVQIYIDGEAQSVDVQKDKLKHTIRTTVPLKIGQRHTTSPLESAGLQDVRIYDRVLKSEEMVSLVRDTRMGFLLASPSTRTDKKSKEELYKGWLETLDSEYQKEKAFLVAAEKDRTDIKARAPITHVMREKEQPPEAYVLFRGEYDKRKDKVESNTPSALPPMPSDFPRNRLGFAKWLLLPEHPLTARVTVNRFWQEIFGVGIVRTTGDLGVSGEMPSHPELLDWLAVDFRESGWDVKRFFKMLVTSAAYRQDATATPASLAKDPSNLLLSRGPRFRMDAEMVRDYALEASGLLVEKIGGPSVKPYQPDGIWEAVAMPGSNTRDYKRDSGEGLYRRSLYTFWKRAAPPPSMEIFNAPSRETCTVRRERSNTPLQALATLNDPQLIEAARNLAQRALKESGKKEEARLDFMARTLLSRPLRNEEIKVTSTVLRELLSHYQAAPKEAEALIAVGDSKPDASLDKSTLAAYTMVANELMNLDEVLNK